MQTIETQPFKTWCIIELLGHKTIAGFATETRLAGADFIAVLIPHVEGTTTTELVSPAAVYRITPCTEETARMVSASREGQALSLYDARSLVSNHDALAGKLAELRRLQQEQPLLVNDDDGEDSDYER
jgi:hypothetical protein